MPRKPSASGFALAIEDDFDDTRNYRVKIIDLEETEARYPGAKPGEMALVWHVTIHRDDGTAFLDTRNDEVWDQWIWSSDSMFKTAKGRGYLEAFMGGEMEDSAIDELIDNGFREGVMGKTALASFEVKFTADGNEQLKVVLLRPDKASGRSKSGTGAAAAPARPVAPPSRTEAEVEADTEPAPAPVASTPSGSRRRAAAADNDLPF